MLPRGYRRRRFLPRQSGYFGNKLRRKIIMSRVVNTIVAAAAGFAAGILLAPKSGKETREEIKEKAREAKGRMDEKASEVADALRNGANIAESEARGMAESAK